VLRIATKRRGTVEGTVGDVDGDVVVARLEVDQPGHAPIVGADHAAPRDVAARQPHDFDAGVFDNGTVVIANTQRELACAVVDGRGAGDEPRRRRWRQFRGAGHTWLEQVQRREAAEDKSAEAGGGGGSNRAVGGTGDGRSDRPSEGA
jgi:hypothetical protein